MTYLTRITAPASEPLTRTAAKAHLRLDSTDEDTLVDALIVAAREWAEHITGRALCTQTWELGLDAFPTFDTAGRPCDTVRLARSPLLAITSIKYDDATGTEQTLSPSAYVASALAEPGTVRPAYATTWPTTRDQANAVRVRYTAGYSSDGTSVPQGIKQWMLLRIGSVHANRQEMVDGRLVPVPFFDRLLDPFVAYGGTTF